MSKIKIVALGGQNEIGKNMYAVEVDEKIFIFEAGLKYADDKLLGVDYIIPNYDYLKENKDKIVGIFITHGHDNQIGALADILVDMPNIKVYGGKFTLEIIKQDLKERRSGMEYDYSKLRGRIIEKFGTIGNFQKHLNISNVVLSKKMNNRVRLSHDDITPWADLLEIPMDQIGVYFFTRK